MSINIVSINMPVLLYDFLKRIGVYDTSDLKRISRKDIEKYFDEYEIDEDKRTEYLQRIDEILKYEID